MLTCAIIEVFDTVYIQKFNDFTTTRPATRRTDTTQLAVNGISNRDIDSRLCTIIKTSVPHRTLTIQVHLN
jgi:hypothetical protein